MDEYDEDGSQRWIGCLCGIYSTGASATFIIVLLMVVLGGSATDFWKPFVWALGWPIMWALTFSGIVDL